MNILDYTLKYLEKKISNFKINKRGKIKLFTCPICKELSCQFVPNTNYKMSCFKCEKIIGNLFDAMNVPEEEIIQDMQKLLNIEITTEDQIKKALDYYKEAGFDLVPIAKNSKVPVEKDWTNKIHIDRKEWETWLEMGLNIGVKTGKSSNITVIDVDTKDMTSKYYLYFNHLEGLIQKTPNGYHYFYEYEKDLPKTTLKTTKEKLDIDIENDGGQVVVFPSIVEDKKREFIRYDDILKMSDGLKEFLKSKITYISKTLEISESEINLDVKEFNIENIPDGSRTNFLMSYGGIIRNKLSIEQTAFVLDLINKKFCNPPLPQKELNNVIKSLDKYIRFEESDLAKKILEYLKLADSASKSEIEFAVFENRVKGENKKKLDKTLVYLIKEEYIIKRGRIYHILRKMEWKDILLDVGERVKFKVPYFDDYAYFNIGDLIIIGSKNKYGKTHLSMNFIKRLVEQGIKPYYIYNEPGGRFAKIGLHLGLKDGDFYQVFCSDAEKIILEPNAITVFDWVRPPDFAQTDKLFNSFTDKLEKTKGFMICFVQLKHDNKFFAENMVGQFPALLSKYVYKDEKDGTFTKFEITDVREAKIKGKRFTIPCKYDWDAKVVYRLDELEEKK